MEHVNYSVVNFVFYEEERNNVLHAGSIFIYERIRAHP
ncbi:hypothetical protein SpAn4DRAFT_2761 [Sporomusa ovata]|uniref:Uncharacterized protein n=1 Tax=Sporomusa ovata TaxID=2378 RepID=A0A0U1KXZ4_9FIRM|nr:hypothetical protein SpAn4DRAFT_2761 [Sporomusa ovata]